MLAALKARINNLRESCQVSFIDRFLAATVAIVDDLDRDQIDQMAEHLEQTRTRGGRLFLLGVGGGAGPGRVVHIPPTFDSDAVAKYIVIVRHSRLKVTSLKV